jgi:large-conductance mechanosensitive channel
MTILEHIIQSMNQYELAPFLSCIQDHFNFRHLSGTLTKPWLGEIVDESSTKETGTPYCFMHCTTLMKVKIQYLIVAHALYHIVNKTLNNLLCPPASYKVSRYEGQLNWLRICDFYKDWIFEWGFWNQIPKWLTPFRHCPFDIGCRGRM